MPGSPREKPRSGSRTTPWLVNSQVVSTRPAIVRRAVARRSGAPASPAAGQPAKTRVRSASRHPSRCRAQAAASAGSAGAARGTKLSWIFVVRSSAGWPPTGNTRRSRGAKSFSAATRIGGSSPFKKRLNQRKAGTCRSCVSLCGPSVIRSPSRSAAPSSRYTPATARWMRCTPSSGKIGSLSVFAISSGRGATSAATAAKSHRDEFSVNIQSQWPLITPSTTWLCRSVMPATGTAARTRSSRAAVYQV